MVSTEAVLGKLCARQEYTLGVTKYILTQGCNTPKYKKCKCYTFIPIHCTVNYTVYTIISLYL